MALVDYLCLVCIRIYRSELVGSTDDAHIVAVIRELLAMCEVVEVLRGQRAVGVPETRDGDEARVVGGVTEECGLGEDGPGVRSVAHKEGTF